MNTLHGSSRLTFFTSNLFLRHRNATLQADGQVVPNDDCTEEFKEYIKEEVKNGTLPFKLHPQLLLFLTQRKYREQFKNTTWKAVKNWKERKVWRPKVHTPIRVFVKGATMDEIARLKGFVFQLTNEKIARLQSLCYFSNLAVTISGKALEHLISRRSLKFEISAKAQSYHVYQGWIQIPCFPKAFQEFSDAIAPLLSEFPVTSNSVSTVYSNAAKKTTKAKLIKGKDAVRAKTVLPKDDKVFGKEEFEEDIEPKEIESTTISKLEVSEDNYQVASSTMKNVAPKVSSLLANSSNQSQEENVLNIPSINIPNKFSSTDLKATSTEFVPLKKRATEHLSGFINNFSKIRFEVTPDNYKDMLARFSELLQSGVEYVALDCEMTGLYTREDEAVHSIDPSQMHVNNTPKLIRAVDKNMMFQLGLTVKTKDKQFSIWSFYTAPTLTEESFTPETFKFLFLKPRDKKDPLVDMPVIQSRIKHIASHSVDAAPFLNCMFHLRTTIVLFSGYVDLMHVLKASKREYSFSHEEIQKQLGCSIYDIKLIAKRILNRSTSLEFLTKELYSDVELDLRHLHDASYDSLLTALVFDKLKNKYGAEKMIQNVLFNYEKH